jgi:hypothetical protein
MLCSTKEVRIRIYRTPSFPATMVVRELEDGTILDAICQTSFFGMNSRWLSALIMYLKELSSLRRSFRI